MFQFQGQILNSKSWLNRAQIIFAYQNLKQLDIKDASRDVIDLQIALNAFQSNEKEFDLGQGGTTFRFFSLFISKKPGRYILKCHPRLMSRPQDGLISLLQQLNVQVIQHKDFFEITSYGWSWNKDIEILGSVSSQFATGLLLNSWKLERKLRLVISKPIHSFEYLNMTLKLLKKSGLNFLIEESDQFLTIQVLPNQVPDVEQLVPELDVSSAFSLAACAIADGDVQIRNWTSDATQPDKVFLDIFRRMEISYEVKNQILEIRKQSKWKSIEWNMNNAPDLFPVLSALAALADGTSCLFGAKQLKDKESDRIVKTAQLLSLCGFKIEQKVDGLRIWGGSSCLDRSSKIVFDPDHDHRMAMAAAVLKLAGFNLQILNKSVVDKSYPQFWSDIGFA